MLGHNSWSVGLSDNGTWVDFTFPVTALAAIRAENRQTALGCRPL